MAKKKKSSAFLAHAWNDYFGAGELKDWQRLCRDLGLRGDLSSKNKCRKVSLGDGVGEGFREG